MTKDDFSALSEMIYSGRGITVGRTPSGNSFIGYSLTGRSPPSQARKLVQGEKTNVIRTEVTDPEQLKKGSPALLLYPAIVPTKDGTLIASNGAQTKLIYSATFNGNNSPQENLLKAFIRPSLEYDEKDDRWINLTTYEPDSPNNTPRISAVVNKESAAIHIVSNNNGKYQRIIPITFDAGLGKLITTYSGGNEKPLAPFIGDLLDVTINSESAQDIAESIYKAIYGGQNQGDNYRVATAVVIVKPSGLETTIINRVDRGS